MNRSLSRLFAVALAFCVPLATNAAQPKPVADPVARATTLLDHLDAGEFSDAEAMFTAQMSQAW